MIIDLHPDLVPVPFRSEVTVETFAETVSGPIEYRKKEGESNRYGIIDTEPVRKPVVRVAIPDDADVYHKSLLGYLQACYGHHHGAVIAPHRLWFTVLSELASHIKSNAEKYRPLFTTNPDGKTEIIVLNLSDDETIDPQVLVTHLQHLVPVGADTFLPQFSTATESYNAAACSAFCDAVSPFYNYSMMLCGIPRIRLEGTVEDWMNFRDHLLKISAHVDGASAYLARLASRIEGIISTYVDGPNQEFWRGMLDNERCGSGGQFEVKGWITEFFMGQPSLAYPENFPSHVAEVKYKNLDTDNKYAMFHGLFASSFDDDGFLVPNYHYVIESRVETATKKK